MKIAIGVMGSSSISDRDILAKASTVGRLIAERGAILITGATTGIPYSAARGAKAAGGEVIGFSPAADLMQHRRLGLPVKDHDLIVYTGLTSAGRNILNVRASQGIIFIGGSMGALNEFTISYDEEKIIGVLEGTGGFCNHIQEWMKDLSKPHHRAPLHRSSDPHEIVNLVFESIRNSFLESEPELP